MSGILATTDYISTLGVAAIAVCGTAFNVYWSNRKAERTQAATAKKTENEGTGVVVAYTEDLVTVQQSVVSSVEKENARLTGVVEQLRLSQTRLEEKVDTLQSDLRKFRGQSQEELSIAVTHVYKLEAVLRDHGIAIPDRPF